MAGIPIGDKAPGFRLPSGQGREVALEDYLGKGPVIVWFTKGMACAFCRQHMSQIVRAYPRLRSLGAEVLEITPSTPAKARFYVEQFRLPFPYLCDPDYSVRRSWLLDVRSHSLLWYANVLREVSKMEEPPSDFGEVRKTLTDIPKLLADDDMGFFIVDREGVVRYSLGGSYVAETGARPIPGNDEILRELEQLNGHHGVA